MTNEEALKLARKLRDVCHEHPVCDNCPFYNPRGLGSCRLNWAHRWELEENE